MLSANAEVVQWAGAGRETAPGDIFSFNCRRRRRSPTLSRMRSSTAAWGTMQIAHLLSSGHDQALHQIGEWTGECSSTKNTGVVFGPSWMLGRAIHEHVCPEIVSRAICALIIWLEAGHNTRRMTLTSSFQRDDFDFWSLVIFASTCCPYAIAFGVRVRCFDRCFL